MRKILIVIPVLLLLAICGYIFITQNESETVATTDSQYTYTPYIPDPPRDIDECLEDAEQAYKLYQMLHTDGIKDIDGVTHYFLSSTEQEDANKSRSSSYDECYKRFVTP